MIVGVFMIGKNVIIHRAILGKNVTIMDNAVIGKEPFKAKRSATTKKEELPPTKIGNNVFIGTGAIIYAGADIDNDVFIADNAVIREHVKVGAETIIGHNTTIENDTNIGAKCKIQTNAYICAFSTIEDYCFIGPGVIFTNDNYVGRDIERLKHFKGPNLKRGARVSAGSIIFPNIVLGEDCLIGAGSIVTENTEPRMIYYGSPAKKIRAVDKKQFIEHNL